MPRWQHCDWLWDAVPVLLAAAVAWVAVVATVNVAAQAALPTWVRAQGLSIFISVFNGMVALGSPVWGYVASLVGIPAAFDLSALCLFVFDLVTTRWRIPGDDMFVPGLSEPPAQEAGC